MKSPSVKRRLARAFAPGEWERRRAEILAKRQNERPVWPRKTRVFDRPPGTLWERMKAAGWRVVPEKTDGTVIAQKKGVNATKESTTTRGRDARETA